MRDKRTHRSREISARLLSWRDRELNSEFRDLHGRISELDSRTQEAMVDLSDLTKKTDEVHTAIKNHDKALSDTSAYQIRLSYLSIFGSMAASLFAAVAAVGSIINRNTLIFLLGSIACFFVGAFLWVRLKEGEPSRDREERV